MARDRPAIPRAVIVAFVVTVAGVALGPWLSANRTALALFFIAWGASWFAAARVVSHDDAWLTHISEARSKLPGNRKRPDFVDRDVPFQRRMYQWLVEPFAIGISLVGVFMLFSQLAVGSR